MAKMDAAVVYMKVKVSDDGSIVTLRKPEVKRLRGRITRQNLQNHRKEFYKELRSLRKHFGHGGLVDDWTRVDTAVKRLHELGRRLACDLFSNDGERREVQRILREACPKWDDAHVSDAEAKQLPTIVVRAKVRGVVPMEFLPLFNMEKPQGRIRTVERLARCLRGFLGFSACVRRVIPDSLRQPTRLNGFPGLPMKFFQHAGLPGVLEEVDFFERNKRVLLDTPWPNKRLRTKEIIREMVACLLDSSRKFDASLDPIPDQVHHFACHCKKDCLILAHKNGYDRKIRIPKLKAEIVSQSASSGYQPPTIGPLAFLNACGSARVDPAMVDSFAEFFSDRLYRGFIGAETTVPDEVAAKFSKAFYTKLLEGESLGRAIHFAKWRLVERYRNPLGILYTVYANPDIRIKAPAHSAK